MESRMAHPDTPANDSPRSSMGKILTGIIFLIGIGAFVYFDLGQYLSLDSLKANRDLLLNYTESHYAVAVAIFILVYILQTAFSLPGGAILTITGASYSAVSWEHFLSILAQPLERPWHF